MALYAGHFLPGSVDIYRMLELKSRIERGNFFRSRGSLEHNVVTKVAISGNGFTR